MTDKPMTYKRQIRELKIALAVSFIGFMLAVFMVLTKAGCS